MWNLGSPLYGFGKSSGGLLSTLTGTEKGILSTSGLLIGIGWNLGSFSDRMVGMVWKA